jgi:heme exporter protein A
MLEAIDITARRGSAVLFTGLRLRVEAGRALLVTGRNGSGKTTLLRILAGLTQPEEGRVHLDGRPAHAMRSHMAFDALAAVDLSQQRDLPARALSAGQRRRVGLARLVLLPRAVWLLDEPATALDTAGLRALADMVAQRLRAGGIVIAATHQALDLLPERTDTLAMA